MTAGCFVIVEMQKMCLRYCLAELFGFPKADLPQTMNNALFAY